MSTTNVNRNSTNEKKVWRPLTASQAVAPIGSRNPDAVHFLAVEELQGAWIDNKVWEEAEGGIIEEWDEESTDSFGNPCIKTIRKEIPRATRYVLKYLDSDGKAKNALSSYDGPREYKN